MSEWAIENSAGRFEGDRIRKEGDEMVTEQKRKLLLSLKSLSCISSRVINRMD